MALATTEDEPFEIRLRDAKRRLLVLHDGYVIDQGEHIRILGQPADLDGLDLFTFDTA